MSSLYLSINKSDKLNALYDWEVVKVNKYSELVFLLKQYSYSASQFRGKRNLNNISGFNNILIFDIDNDPHNNQLTINEAEILLKKKNISAMILPSKSHKIEKFTRSGKSKGIKDRYRIIIPIKRAIDINLNKYIYQEFQRLVVDELELEGSVDLGALNDRARYYYKSPSLATPIIITASRVMDISYLEGKAVENINKMKEDKNRYKSIRREFEKSIKENKKKRERDNKKLTFTDVEEVMNIPIDLLITRFEGGDRKEEGKYCYIKTNLSKYSIIENNLAYDFKSDITYNSLTYLFLQYKTNNINLIARELWKDLGINCININIEAVKIAIREALLVSVNDKFFENAIKNYFGCKYCKFDFNCDTIKIADQSLKLSEIGLTKGEIINRLRENRVIQRRM